jgi:hypothetical protein
MPGGDPPPEMNERGTGCWINMAYKRRRKMRIKFIFMLLFILRTNKKRIIFFKNSGVLLNNWKNYKFLSNISIVSGTNLSQKTLLI